MTSVYDKERSLEHDISRRVQRDLPEVDVLAVEISNRERFTVFIDHPAGVTHALCQRVTDVLRDYLREYAIDVSSPGIERPLRKPEHFRAAVGRKVALRTAPEVEGRKRFRGEVVDAGEGAVTVKTGDDAVDIPYDAIVRGNLISEG